MNYRVTRRSVGKCFLSTIVVTAESRNTVAAERLAEPESKPILTISGRIEVFNKNRVAEFDRAMLEALGTDEFVTMTPWSNVPVRFEGVRMARLMEAVGSTGESVTAIALNDYSTDIPITDFQIYGTIIALKRDGNYMSVRDKGPLFIVYPYDSSPELRHQRFYSRSAWQVSKLVVK